MKSYRRTLSSCRVRKLQRCCDEKLKALVDADLSQGDWAVICQLRAYAKCQEKSPPALRAG